MPINMSIEYPKLEKRVMDLERQKSELLEACKQSLKVLCYPSAIQDSKVREIYDIVHNAISKAEGK